MLSRAVLTLAATTLLACGDSKGPPSTPGANVPVTGAPPAAASVKPTGRVISIEMTTDEKGNYFTPAKFEAHRGDVLRFVLKAGVHNVHFVADSNPGKVDLPPVSDFLQIPGQTWDLTVALAPGHYVFQCDPHAALGMIARLEVEDEK
jgi:plastocyanin